VPVLTGIQFLVQDEARLVTLGLQFLIKGVNFIVWISVDDPGEGSASGEIGSQHHIVVYLACFPLDVEFQDALELNVPPLEAILG